MRERNSSKSYGKDRDGIGRDDLGEHAVYLAVELTDPRSELSPAAEVRGERREFSRQMIDFEAGKQ